MIQENEDKIEEFRVYLLSKARRETTVNQYCNTLKLFFSEYLTQKLWSNITKKDADNFIVWKMTKESNRHNKNMTGRNQGRLSNIKGRLEATSINAYISAFKKFFLFIEKYDQYEALEFAKKSRWKPDLNNSNQIINFFEKASYIEIQAKVRKALLAKKKNKQVNNFYVERNTLLIYVLFNTGARVGEAANIQIKDFNFNKKKVSLIIDGKTGKRTILLSPKVSDRIVYFVKTHNIKSFLFCKYQSNDNIPVNSLKTFIWRLFRWGFEKEFHAHDLRHAYATFLIRHGVHIKRISNDLGHSSLDTTGIYLDLEEGKNAEVSSPADFLENDS
jgi:site-specific recombinase XerD